jgi:hypothetical protein
MERSLRFPFQTSSTRCWVSSIEEDRFDQIWRALHVSQRFYMYARDADDPGSAMFSLQDRDFHSEEEFKEFSETVKRIIDEANTRSCQIELAYYPAGSLKPRFSLPEGETS